ncbi:MAG TPA: hypothetical protein VFV58_37775 [Blastocatellia bacterium]|nr:hypothetical protein [Blastocatellia bacterium]
MNRSSPHLFTVVAPTRFSKRLNWPSNHGANWLLRPRHDCNRNNGVLWRYLIHWIFVFDST